MLPSVVLLGLGALFVLALVTKRRFGVLGLGLAAGVILASQFAEALALLFVQQQLVFEPFSNQAIARALLVLAPSLFLLIGGPKYDNYKTAFIGGLLFVGMTSVILLSSFASGLPWLSSNWPQVIDFIDHYQGLLVAAGVVLAVVDMFLAHSGSLKLGRRRSRKT